MEDLKETKFVNIDLSNGLISLIINIASPIAITALIFFFKDKGMHFLELHKSKYELIENISKSVDGCETLKLEAGIRALTGGKIIAAKDFKFLVKTIEPSLNIESYARASELLSIDTDNLKIVLKDNITAEFLDKKYKVTSYCYWIFAVLAILNLILFTLSGDAINLIYLVVLIVALPIFAYESGTVARAQQLLEKSKSNQLFDNSKD